MGRRTLAISPEILVGLCKSHDAARRTYTVENPIPDDAKIVGEFVSPHGTLEVVLESREWPAQKRALPEPVDPKPTFTLHYEEVSDGG